MIIKEGKEYVTNGGYVVRHVKQTCGSGLYFNGDIYRMSGDFLGAVRYTSKGEALIHGDKYTITGELNRMTHDEMIAVMQAHKEGKKIEVCRLHCGEWHAVDNPKWNFEFYTYRVAEPKWRDATVDDIARALRGERVEARFLRDGSIMDVLVGGRLCSGETLFMAGNGMWYTACQVKEES
jgi:hypothetical protein